MPEIVFAEVVAVVAGEHDDGVLAQAEVIQCVEQASDLRIHEGDRRIVCGQ